MRFHEVAALALVALFLKTPAGFANQWTTGNDLLGDCVADEKTRPAQAGFCLGFVSAISAASTCGAGGVSGFASEAPAHVTLGQLTKVVIKWLNQNPDKLHLAASSLVAKALEDAFPCP